MIEERLLRVVRALVRESLPRYDFLRRYRYRVVQMSGDRVELQIVRKQSGLPNTLPISICPGMAGLSAMLTPGSIVLVEFIDGDTEDEAQPVVTHFAGKDQEGFLPVALALDATTQVRIGETAPAVIVGGPVPAPQPVALAPATVAALQALQLFAGAVVAYAGAVAVALPVTSAASTTLATAYTALTTALGPLLGAAPSGLTSTKLSAH